MKFLQLEGVIDIDTKRNIQFIGFIKQLINYSNQIILSIIFEI